MSSHAFDGAEQPAPDDSHKPQPADSAPRAEVLSLAHARDACTPSLDREKRHACIERDFAELVQPLGIVGPNRDVCLDAFREAPDAFGQLVAAALARGNRPAALLVRMVKCGDHRKLAAAARSVPTTSDGPSLLDRRMAERAEKSAWLDARIEAARDMAEPTFGGHA